MSLTGDLVTAAQAHAAGLVSEVLPPAELLPRATEIASSIASNNARAVGALLASYREVESELVAGGYAVEGRTARAWGESDLDLAESGRSRAVLMERARRQTSEDS
jgi:enoyl-CoA hydratase